MTRRYSNSEWLDVLYTSVRNTPGGVAAAAAFLTNRRGRSIATEALRLRLNGQGENRLSMEMFELLLEWMQEQDRPDSHDALHALNERFGLHSMPLDIEDDADTTHAVSQHTLALARRTGEAAEEVRVAPNDGVITPREADDIAAAARSSRRILDQLVQTVQRVSKLSTRRNA